MPTKEKIMVDHPGSFIQEELDERGWSQRDLAYILGAPEPAVNLIISGKRGISPDMAKSLGNAFDVPAEFFVNLQKAFDLANAKEPNPGITTRARLQSSYPIREMIRRGWLENTDTALLEAQLARFFQVKKVQEIPHFPHAAKKSNYEKIHPHQVAWLFRVRQIAESFVTPRYSEKELLESIPKLKQLLSEPEEVRHIPRIMNECGVRFVIVETLPKVKIDGVCFWLNNSFPVIGMSLRYDRIDNFWFVLRHEIEHVLRKDGREERREMIDVELEGKNAETGISISVEERVANNAAINFCIPKNEFDDFYNKKYPFFSERDVTGFAKRLGIHAGLVVGQIQNKTKKYNFLRKYLKNVRKHILPATIVDGWGEVVPVNL